jgi:HSP20 family protein
VAITGRGNTWIALNLKFFQAISIGEKGMVEVFLRSDSERHAQYYQHDIRPSNDDPVYMKVTIRPHIWRPPTDVYETDDEVIVRVEIAGMQEEDFSIILDNQSLLVRGVRVDPAERRAYHQMEIPFGEFATEVELHHPIDVSRVEAVYNNGFLRISLPKAHPQKIVIADE